MPIKGDRRLSSIGTPLRRSGRDRAQRQLDRPDFSANTLQEAVDLNRAAICPSFHRLNGDRD